jgi:hypothetical protein
MASITNVDMYEILVGQKESDLIETALRYYADAGEDDSESAQGLLDELY